MTLSSLRERYRAIWSRRAVRWPVNAASVLLMIPFVFWLAFKALAQDEPLRDEIDPLLKVERPAEDIGNLYYALVGLTAPEKADAHRVGTLSVMMAFDRIDTGTPVSEVSLAGQGSDALPLAPLALPCTDGSRVCLRELKANIAAWREWDKQHAVLLDRHLDAARLPRYVDVEIDAPQVAQRLQILSDATRQLTVERWVRGQVPVAIEVLDRSLTLCRRVLGGTASLELKRTAAMCMRDGWQLAAALALDATPAVRARHGKAVRALTSPLEPEAFAFAPIVRTQLRNALPELLESPAALAVLQPERVWREALLRPFFQRNATLNLYYERFMAQAALDRRSPAEVLRFEPAPIPRGVWQRLETKNPVGLKVIETAPAAPLLADIIQLRTLESHRRLAARVIDCALDAALAKDAAACASGTPTALRDPFDGALPTFDPAREALLFAGHSSASGANANAVAVPWITRTR